MLGRKLQGKSQRELRDLGLLVEDDGNGSSRCPAEVAAHERGDVMADTQTDVLVGGYQDIDDGDEGLRRARRARQGQEGRDRGRDPRSRTPRTARSRVQQTADHRGRKGVGWGGGVGVLVGLAAPPLLAADRRRARPRAGSSASSSTSGSRPRCTTRSARTCRRGRPGSSRSSTTSSGSPSSRRSRARSRSRSSRRDKKGVKALKDGLAEAMGKFVPDRTVLPIPDRNFGGTIGPHARRSRSPTGRSSPAPKAPEGAPNVLLVLIDDAGFGQPDTFGGPVATPNLTRVAADGPHLQPLPRDRALLADPGGDADRAQPAPRRHGLGRASSPARSPATRAPCRGAARRSPRILKENGYVDRRVRQVAPDAGPRAGRRRARSTTGRRPGASTTSGAS